MKELLTRLQACIQYMPEEKLQLFEPLMEEYSHELIKEPQSGLLMAKSRDTFGTYFYMGEILITECTVSVDGFKGFGAVLGNVPYKAWIVATIFAIAETPANERRTAIEEQLLLLLQPYEKAQQVEHAFVESTRVMFESMSEE